MSLALLHVHESVLLPPGLMPRIRAQFRLDWQGIHGAPHWARVMRHGRVLAPLNGADEFVVRLFAVLHDSMRWADDDDPDHGSRAAEFSLRLHREGLLGLNDAQADRLAEACQRHSAGHRQAHPTVQTCWDADRLDLGRVGLRPDPRRLCTAAARQSGCIERAWRWSRSPLR